MRWVTLYADAVIKPRDFSNPQWPRFHLHSRRPKKATRTRVKTLKIRRSAEIQGKGLKYQNLEMPPAVPLPSTPYFLFEGFARVEAAEWEREEN